jgi:hypothetical protein
MAMLFDQITGPAHWASYLVNGDASGLLDDEKAKADAWLEREGVAYVVGCSDNAHFTWHMRLYAPELDCEGGDVLDYTVELNR